MHLAAEINPFFYLERNAETAPRGVFLESSDQRILNTDALAYAKKIAYELRRIGVKPGDVVALDLPESLSILFTEAVFHEACVGSVLPRGFAEDHALPIDWIFSSQPRSLRSDTRVITVDAAFLRQIEQNPFGISPRPYESQQSIVRLVFSSGTTGKPKPIALTHEMVEFRSAAAKSTWMLGEPFMSLLDTSTVSGFFTFYASVLDGRTLLVTGSAHENVQLMERRSVASLKASPAQVASLVAQLEEGNRTLNNLQTVYVAGSVLPPGLAGRLRQRTGCEVFNMYGSSEAGTVAGRYRDSDDPFDAGHLTPESILEIVDEDDLALPDGEAGRIRYQRPLMAEGYFGDPEATNINFKNGWFYPGDYGTIQPDGSLVLQGRSSEILNAGGVKVDPTQLDLYAVAQPKVVDACSFGYMDNFGLQQIGLALVAEDDIEIQSVIKNFENEFGAAAPKLMVRVREVPRNSMGKPLRAVLAEKHREG